MNLDPNRWVQSHLWRWTLPVKLLNAKMWRSKDHGLPAITILLSSSSLNSKSHRLSCNSLKTIYPARRQILDNTILKASLLVVLFIHSFPARHQVPISLPTATSPSVTWIHSFSPFLLRYIIVLDCPPFCPLPILLSSTPPWKKKLTASLLRVLREKT